MLKNNSETACREQDMPFHGVPENCLSSRTSHPTQAGLLLSLFFCFSMGSFKGTDELSAKLYIVQEVGVHFLYYIIYLCISLACLSSSTEHPKAGYNKTPVNNI